MKIFFIYAYVIDHHHNNFKLTCLYGHPEVHLRQHVCNQLIETSYTMNNEDEWIVIGVFNQILSKKDKLSFHNTNLRGTQALKECLDQCQLSKIPPKVQFLTWTNNRQWDEVVWERLDRVLPFTSGLGNMMSHN